MTGHVDLGIPKDPDALPAMNNQSSCTQLDRELIAQFNDGAQDPHNGKDDNGNRYPSRENIPSIVGTRR